MRPVTKTCAQRKWENRTTNWNKGRERERQRERERKKEKKRTSLFLEHAMYLALDLSRIDWHLRGGKVTNRSNTAVVAVRKTEIFDCNDVSYKTKCMLVEETFRFFLFFCQSRWNGKWHYTCCLKESRSHHSPYIKRWVLWLVQSLSGNKASIRRKSGLNLVSGCDLIIIDSSKWSDFRMNV